MNKLKEIEAQFRELNEFIVKEYEEKLQDLKEQQVRRGKRLAQGEKEIRDMFHISGVDPKRLDDLERKDSEYLAEYLKDVRPGMVGRPTSRAQRTKEYSVYATLAGETRSILMKPYAACLMVPEITLAEGVEGEKGNPWILPYNPEDINIKRVSTGSGWGCWATGLPAPLNYDVWFHFVPDKTAVWELVALFAFYGFYILRANDKWYNCKSAEVLLQVDMNVWQYFWRGWKSFKLIDKKDDNIEFYDYYDSGQFLDFTTALKAGDSTWVLVRISLYAFALGGGSYAEINFSDGSANYIKPFLVSAGPL